MRQMLAAVVATALMGAGCSSNKKDTSASSTSTAKPGSAAEQVTILMDGRTGAYNGVFTAYFPSEVSVHPGTTVDFKMPYFNGEPHTVTLGTLVDAGVQKLEFLGPTASPAQQENTPELKNLPDLFPHEFSASGGTRPDVNQSAAQPCYEDTGVPPLSLTGGAPACLPAAEPQFNGRQAFFNSGALAQDNASYTVKLADDIAPGAYGVFCLIHRGTMFGKLNVVNKATPVPSAAEVATKANDEFQGLAKVLQSAYTRVPPPATVLAGSGLPNIFNAFVAEFLPKEVTVAAGQSVTWNSLFFHTISFNAPPDAVPPVKASGHAVHLNPTAFAPSNSPPLPAAYNAFPPKASAPYLLNGGSFDGTGYKNTGLLISIPPSIVSYKVTFTKPGSYSYVCLLHPNMAGVVKVT
jgi:plastocyanin